MLCRTVKKTVPSSKKRKSNVISLSTDDDDDEPENQLQPTSPLRSPSLTPPPVVGPEALKQAMAVISEHRPNPEPRPRSTRQQISTSQSSEPLPLPAAEEKN